MVHYISKDALVAELERKLDELYKLLPNASKVENGTITISEASNTGKYTALESFMNYIDTIEVKDVDLEKKATEFVQTKEFVEGKESPVLLIAKHFYGLGLKVQSKDMIEALRTEYEKGRADVIADTLSWLANCWPKYCSNQTIIDGYKEAIKYD